MDYLISCSCGHTLEQHVSDGGCEACVCPLSRGAALDAAIENVQIWPPAELQAVAGNGPSVLIHLK